MRVPWKSPSRSVRLRGRAEKMRYRPLPTRRIDEYGNTPPPPALPPPPLLLLPVPLARAEAALSVSITTSGRASNSSPWEKGLSDRSSPRTKVAMVRWYVVLDDSDEGEGEDVDDVDDVDDDDNTSPSALPAVRGPQTCGGGGR